MIGWPHAQKIAALWRNPNLRLVLIILCVQALFWGTLSLIGERQSEYRFMKSHEIHEIYVHALPGLRPDFGPRVVDTKQNFPFTPGACYLGYRSPAYQISFDIMADARTASAIYVPWASDNFETYMNGALLGVPRGQFSLVPSREERRPFLMAIPRDRLQNGRNRIDMVVTRKGCTPYVETAYFGPLSAFKAYESHMLFLGHYVPIITAIAGALVAFFTLSLIPISGYSPKILSLSVFLAAISLRAYVFVWSGNGLDYTVFFALVYFVNYVCFFTAALCVQIWSGAPKSHSLWIGAIFGIFSCLLFAFTQGGDIYSLVMKILNPMSIALLSSYIIWRLWRIRNRHPADVKRALVIASLFLAVELYDAMIVIFNIRRFIDAGFYLPIVIIMGVAAHLIRYGHRLYDEAETARKSLALQVAWKEQEIRDSYTKLREQENLNAIHTERQRLIRDMHDGVGGQLVSLMLQLKVEDIPKERIQKQVQAAIDDLRLVIDSMDSAGSSLDIALAIFQERMGPRLKSANISLIWNNHSDNKGEDFKPQAILHIYRILQEGVTNILKYAEASQVTLSLVFEEDVFKIELIDNGKGFDVQSKVNMGRGINHMRKRATLLGGQLDIVSVIGEGTRLSFYVPSH